MSTTSPVPLEPSPSFDVALRVGDALENAKMDTGNGIGWPLTFDEPEFGGYSLYHGSAGIALFQLELARATGQRRYLDNASNVGDAILHYLSGRTWLSVAPASGWAGHAFALNEIAEATQRPELREAAKTCLTQLRSQAQKLGSGIGWIEPMPFSDITGFTGDREIYDQSVGASGAGSYFLYAHRHQLHDDALDWATAVGNRLLEVSERDDTGLRWRLMSDMPFPFTAPNFAHGGAGVGYFLADLFRCTEDQRFLDAAIEAASYVKARATPSGEGSLVCHTEEPKRPLFYLGACHGPVGTGRLFSLLSAITNDPSWVAFAHELMQGLIATGAPEVRSEGLWLNHSQCCGDAGIGDYATLMSTLPALGQIAMYTDIAARCANYMMRVAESVTGGAAWRQAEHRVRPDFIQRQTGYMQGAAGIGSFLLHHAAAAQGRHDIKIVLPDMQFS